MVLNIRDSLAFFAGIRKLLRISYTSKRDSLFCTARQGSIIMTGKGDGYGEKDFIR